MRGPKPMSIVQRIQRFMSNIRKTQTCWIWTAGKTGNGYGVFGDARAHRVAWFLKNGPIPSSLVICHNCDVKACVNPDHLMLGTPKDNYLDRPLAAVRPRYMRIRKHTGGGSGERNGHAKLTDGRVLLIRAMYATGRFTQTEIANGLGVSPSTVGLVLKGETWDHVKPSGTSELLQQ